MSIWLTNKQFKYHQLFSEYYLVLAETEYKANDKSDFGVTG